MATTINDRLDIRITKEQKSKLRQAADMLGYKSLSEFVTTFMLQEANKVIEKQQTLMETLADQELFVNELLNPSPPNDALKNAKRKHVIFQQRL